jgi:predicted TIM-barrel fold metal-dependent hydrolase
MNVDDMIMVSIDDHAIEPRDLFQRHLPERFRSEAPHVEQLDNGADAWIYDGQPIGFFYLSSVATWPPDEWDMDLPTGFRHMRPACYDIDERVRDMNANGLLASMCFPTFAGFAGQALAGAGDEALTSHVISAYNDWHIDEWAGTHPGRILPLAIGPLRDVDAMATEIRRVAAKGCTAIAMPETPYAVGLPSYYTDYWEPVFEALTDTDMAICMHIGPAFSLLTRPPEAPHDQLIIMSPQLSAIATTDLMVSGVLRRFPTLRVALSEGGIGWIPFLLDRIDRHLVNQTWTGLDFEGLTATEVFRRNFLGCFITDPSSLALHDRIGIDSIAWECDYPHSDSTWPRSPEILLAEMIAAGLSDADMEKVTWQNASRFFRFDPFAHRAKEACTVGALRSEAQDVDLEVTSREEYAQRYEHAS